MLVSASQPVKATSPRVLRPAGSVTLVSPMQALKAYVSIVVTPLGIVTLGSAMQASVFTTDYYSIFYR